MDKQKIFLDKRDYVRFLFLIIHYQSPITFTNPGHNTKKFITHSTFNIRESILNKITESRSVSINSFCLMPNHFHLLAEETKEGGIARYMQRVLNGYTKYFNAKYKKSGHLFQGPYQAVHVENNKQLLYSSAYIHRNPRELATWKNKEGGYPWSSYQDYISANRWDALLSIKMILDQFDSQKEYHEYVRTNPAKER